MRSKTTIGVASTERVPSSISVLTSPSESSWSSGASSTSATATVRRSRAARFETGSRAALSPIGGRPSTHHSARIGSVSPLSPILMKQREAPIARPVSVTATRVTASRSCTERTRREILPTSRSRASAWSSAYAERVRSSAIAASPARACISRSSSGVKERRSCVGAAISTPTTRSSTISGTNAPLFALAALTSRWLTSGDDSTSYTATGAASK